MSRQELVSAYLDGRVSRRTLVRRLIAAGVSAGAAVSYAQLLSPERAGARGLPAGDDHYPLVDLRIRSSDLQTVRQESEVRVKVTTSEELRSVFIRILLKTPGGGDLIGYRFFGSFLDGAGTRTVVVPINRVPLQGRSSARIYATLRGQDDEHADALASASRTLR